MSKLICIIIVIFCAVMSGCSGDDIIMAVAGAKANTPKIDAGYYANTVAIREDKTLWTWGENGSGQLGYVSTELCGAEDCSTVPVQVETDNDWYSIASGRYFTVAIKRNGTLWAWGENGSGQLGYVTTETCNGDPCSTKPLQVGTENNWTEVATGNYHCIALKKDGTLWAWGLNNTGQLGDGSTINRPSPVQIGTDKDWSEHIAAAYQHTLAVKKNGSLWAWGWNDWGQLGDDSADICDLNGDDVNCSKSPQQVGADNDWSAVATGAIYSIALKYNGTLWGWGYNAVGTLGDGTEETRFYPVQIGSENNWRSIAAGPVHTLGLKKNGTLWAWGQNNWGQLGYDTLGEMCANNDHACSKLPQQVGSDNDWAVIEAGGRFTIALKKDWSYWAWGGNISGQLGDGTTDDRYSPTWIWDASAP